MKIQLKRFLKNQLTFNPKLFQSIKTLLEKIELNSSWVEEKRREIVFSPKEREAVEGDWLKGVEVEETPVGKWWIGVKKVRDRKREQIEKAVREGRSDKSEQIEGMEVD
jgi:nucleolar complex protein 2